MGIIYIFCLTRRLPSLILSPAIVTSEIENRFVLRIVAVLTSANGDVGVRLDGGNDCPLRERMTEGDWNEWNAV